MRYVILILIGLLASFSASAVQYDVNADLFCKPTSEFKMYFTPEKREIVNSNNLRKIPNDAWFSNGAHIKFLGKVLDSNCIPVQNAVVEIWQNDADANNFRNAQSDYFNGSGRAVTNNIGEFLFLTVMPKTNHSEIAPTINVRVRHKEHGELMTKVYFPYHPKNASDTEFLSNVDKNIIMATQYIGDERVPDKIFIHDIVFDAMSTEDHY